MNVGALLGFAETAAKSSEYREALRSVATDEGQAQVIKLIDLGREPGSVT